MNLSRRANSITASPTMAVLEEVAKLKDKGIEVLDLGPGQPDFHTPESIKLSANKAIEENFTRYTEPAGILELRKAVIEKYRRDFGAQYKPNEVVISSGGKHSLFNLMLAIIEEGDEVLIPAPYWVSYPQQVILAGGKLRFIELQDENQFVLTRDILEESLTANTKAVIINTPSNPTGSVIPGKELEKIAELALIKRIYIIFDECYEKLTYDGIKHFSLAFLQEAKEVTLIINSVSKTYAMPGWRIGFALGPEKVISTVTKLQSHTTSAPCSISQKAAVEALSGSQDFIKDMLAQYTRRRDYMVEALNSIPGISCHKPQGAFYIFPNITQILESKNINSSEEFSRQLVSHARVAVVPGSSFGKEGYLRLSFATSIEVIKESLKRMKKFVEGL
ncbi:MAG: pyridoxal phosphate-dependent aminotransferase [Acidobacteriota bacterium]